MSSTEAARARSGFPLSPDIVARNWAFFFLLLLIAVFGITGRGFFSVTNFQNIAHLSTVFLILAAAETFVIITGGIDLSVGFVMGLASVSGAMIMRALHAAAFPEPVSMAGGALGALAISLVPGFANGMLVSRYRVPPFIATMGMWGIANGITLRLCEGFPISFLPPQLTEIGNGFLLYLHPERGMRFFRRPEGLTGAEVRELVRILPLSTIFVGLLLLLLWHLLRNTRFGLHTYAIGDNRDAAVRSGIDTRRHLLTVYILSSFLAGIAGVFNVFQTGVGNFTPFGAMYELFAVAAVVIGGASLMGGKGRIVGSAIGVLLLAVLENGLAISGVPPFYRFIAVGLILILAVVIDRLFPDLF